MKKVLRYGARVIGILLILFGLYQLAAPSISNWLIENNIIKQSEVFDKTSAEDIQKNKQKKGTFDFDAITAINPSETLLNPANIDPSLIIGRLYIPSIQVNLILLMDLIMIF